MRKSSVTICPALDEESARRVVLLCASMGIDAVSEVTGHGRASVRVPAADADRALALLRDEFPFGPEAAADDRVSPQRTDELDGNSPESWFGPGSAAVLAIVAACVVVYYLAYGGEDGGSRSRLLASGAISWSHVERGQWWRLASGIFLHFGLPHLIVNMAALLVLGPPLARDIGPARFLALFLASGVAGNLASHFWTPMIGLKAGASGSVAGVLGALAGQALHPAQKSSRYRSWQVLGALAAVYGLLIGFGPGRDNVAHLGGLLAGLLLGRVIDPVRLEPRSALRAGAGPPRSG